MDSIAACQHEEILASFTYKTYESENRSFCVFRFKNYDTKKEFTAVGSMLPDSRNVPVKLTGDWELNKKNGHRQFKVAYYEQAKPSGRTEVVAFFTALHCGIGKIKAQAVWGHFGCRTWEIVENNPERLLEVPMISDRILKRFLQAMKENGMLRRLIKLTSKAGISLSGETLHALIDRYGSEAEEILLENPYAPCGTVYGYSFDRADAIAVSLGYPMDSENRLIAAIYKVLDDAGWKDSDGDGIREKNGTKLVIRWLTYPSRQELPLLAEAVQADLKKIGIEVDINNTANRREFLADMTSFDIYASALVTAPSGDPQYFFTTSCLPEQSYNFGAYENDKVNELMDELALEFDTDKRADLAVKLQQEILDDNAYIFCSFLEMNMISKANVKNYTAHACDYYQVTAALDIE